MALRQAVRCDEEEKWASAAVNVWLQQAGSAAALVAVRLKKVPGCLRRQDDAVNVKSGRLHWRLVGPALAQQQEVLQH